MNYRGRTYLTKFGELFLIDMVLRPIALGTAMHVNGNAVFIGTHDPLNIILFKSFGKVTVRVGSILQDPGTSTGKSVATIDDVPVFGKAAQHVFHALLQRV